MVDDCLDAADHDDIVQVVDVKNLLTILHEDEITVFDMTSLGTLMLLGHMTNDTSKQNDPLDDDTDLQRLSLAYERLHSMPQLLLEELAPHMKILDLSYNEFENLDFLSDFKELTHLICDHNKITSRTVIPFLPKLELLWLNHCKISELYPWARKLQQSCPNLKYLSLMGNQVAPSYLNGGCFYEYLHYRLFIISLFPSLIHLDDKVVTLNQVKEAQKIYHKPLVERIMSKTQKNLPSYLRVVSEKVSEILSPTHSVTVSEKKCYYLKIYLFIVL
ncbi:hypothetical protein NQ314_011856 [Rhamnusium bicolor]|uniref:Uncharacterized protein n=1 Tax=Rhamnusium bicolor TaxID=1586634 RepID=A0AAV8XFM0_9CUCU|nr:hypothetical protein NQ314_011856 [Rhamnusium bicolor]